MIKTNFKDGQLGEFHEDISKAVLVPSFYQAKEKLKKWVDRFAHADDDSIFNDLLILYLISSKKFLDHRTHVHLFRMALSVHFMQKKLYRSATLLPNQRSVEIRWIPATLEYPFSSKPVLGCLIGFNMMDRYELFDEENVLLVLQKYLPGLNLVKESSYSHASQHKNLKIFYFEIEKQDRNHFSLQEQKLLQQHLQDKVKNTIQALLPTVFMSHNQEEVYKNILVLSQEIRSVQDLPQVNITLDSQTSKKIIFLITLVYISPLLEASLDKFLADETFILERTVTVKRLRNRPVEARIFRVPLDRDPSFLRSNGSLNFYSARQKVASLIKAAIGKFRDYNGGIIIKQQELLHDFKERFLKIAQDDPELIESFFYGITPLEKQAVLELDALAQLFQYFLDDQRCELAEGVTYSFKTHHGKRHRFLLIHWKHLSIKEKIAQSLREHDFKTAEIAYNFLETEGGVFFNCLLAADTPKSGALITALAQMLEDSNKKMQGLQVLRIGMDYSEVSLDPRIGGDSPSVHIVRLLFEGLTRFNEQGQVENAIAESVEVSPDHKQYKFKLRQTFWNDGTPLTAYDFEYAWKKILSTSFQTEYAHLFYSIKNAQNAKEGKISPDQIGIYVEDPLTLKVELRHPTPYFLQLTACPLYSPVRKQTDELHPEWSYQNEKNYPCNGPFELKINRLNQGFRLAKNSFYWNTSRVKLDEVFVTYMNPSQAIHAFNKKEIDWIGDPFGIWDASYVANQNSQVICFPNKRVCWCTFNTASAPFHHRKLRQAFAHAIQRAKLVKNGFVRLNPAYAPLLPHHREKDVPLFPEYHKEKAQQLFQESLEELGIHQKDFQISLLCGEIGIKKYTAVSLQQQFQECFGIKCYLKPMPWGEQFKRMVSGSFQLGLVNWSSYIDDPIYTLGYFKSSKQGVNFSKWEHPQFQQLIDLSEQEVDPRKRHAYLHQAESILGDDMPIVPLVYLPGQALTRKKLQMDQSSSASLSFNIATSFYQTNNQGGLL